MALQDIKNWVTFTTAILPAAKTSTTTSSAVDLQGYNAILVHVAAGVWTDGTHTFSLTECATSGGSFTAVAAGDLLGTAPAISSSGTASQQYTFGYRGSKRYIKVVATVTGSPSTGAVYSAEVMLSDPRHFPAGATQAP